MVRRTHGAASESETKWPQAESDLDDIWFHNAGYTQANAVTLPFRSGAFDVAFLVAVLGEVPDPKACLASIADLLRPGGRLSVAELPGDPDALTEGQLRTLTQGTGLELVESVRVSRARLASFRRQTKTPGTTADDQTLEPPCWGVS